MPAVPPVRVLDSPKGWKIVPVHYSMDPEKNAEWVAHMKRRGEIDDWEKEMEINFSSVAGVRCFESYSILANTVDEVEYEPLLPLRLACDFNVDPMAWLVCQINNNKLYVLREIWESPGSVIENCEKFLNNYGDHYGEVFVYGDAAGNARSHKDQRSNYDEIALRLMNRPFRLRMRVPSRNPTNVNSVRAVNRRLADQWGNPMILIDRAKCKNLLLDLSQTIWQEGGSSATQSIKKTRNKLDPYFYRGHAADALCAIVHREWPTRAEVAKEEDKREQEEKRGKGRMKKKQPPRLRGAFPD